LQLVRDQVDRVFGKGYAHGTDSVLLAMRKDCQSAVEVRQPDRRAAMESATPQTEFDLIGE